MCTRYREQVADDALAVELIRAVRAWKDGGYEGVGLNDEQGLPSVEVTELAPGETGFTAWTRQTGRPDLYRDPDGTSRGTATYCQPRSSQAEGPAAGASPAALLYMHGGGYRKYKPTDGYVIAVASRLAEACAAPVLSIDYRLAPEYDVASRAAVDDCLAGIRWLTARCGVGARIFLVGDSAGAGLALASTLALVEQERAGTRVVAWPAGVVLMSPYIDLTMDSPGFQSNMFSYDDATGDIFYSNHCKSSDPEKDRAWLRNRAKDYIGTSIPGDPYCSPVFIEDDALRQFPPILAMVGGAEVFLHETEALAERAGGLGVNAQLRVYDRMWHDWFNFCELPSKVKGSGPPMQQAVAAYRDVADWIRGLAQGSTEGNPQQAKH